MLRTSLIGISEGEAREIKARPGPPPRIDGVTISAPYMTREPPHAGEMHQDRDVVLMLISGKVTVVIEDQDPALEVALTPGQAAIVPRTIWHRVRLIEPSQLLHIAPGPGGECRPLGPSK